MALCAFAGVWLCRFWINPKHRLLWPLVCWPVLLFMGYAVARYLTADVEFTARQEVLKVLIYGFLFLAILHNLHRLETTQIVAMTLIGLGTVLSLYALLQFLTESERVWHFVRPEIYYKRGSGTFIIPNSLAGYLGMLLPMALVFTLTARLSHLQKVLMGYASLMIFTGILVTISRGGWIATGITLTVLFVWLLQYRDYRLQCLLLMAEFGDHCRHLLFHRPDFAQSNGEPQDPGQRRIALSLVAARGQNLAGKSVVGRWASPL